MVGSWSVPPWLERLKDDFHHHRLSGQHLQEIADVAIKAALKDQELAGVDIVSDGELRRDNDVDYLLARIPGVDVTGDAKAYYFDYAAAEAAEPLPAAAADDTADTGLGLVEEYLFTSSHTDLPVKISLTGPFSLSRRVANRAYEDDAGMVLALAEVLHAEAMRLAAAGATRLQLDEPFLAGYPEHAELAMQAVNVVTEGVDVTWSLHVCYGNRYARPSWEGHYDFLFPAVLDANVDQLMLEFARKGDGDLQLLGRYGWDRGVGLGVIDVKSQDVEREDVVTARIRRGLEVVSPDRLSINPDCGLRHLPPDVARAKLRAMVNATHHVRETI